MSQLPVIARVRMPGYSVGEIIMLVCVVATLICFATVSFGNLDEQKDAEVVQSAQVELQTIVSKGAARLDMRPSEFQDDQLQAVLLDAKANIGELGSQGRLSLERSGRQYILTITESGRRATYDLSPAGNVTLRTLDRFGSYQVRDGVIQKAP